MSFLKAFMPSEEEFEQYCKDFDDGKIEFPRCPCAPAEAEVDVIEVVSRMLTDPQAVKDHFGLHPDTELNVPEDTYEYIPTYVGDDFVVTTNYPQAAFAQLAASECFGMKVSKEQTGFSHDAYPLAERYIVSAPSRQSRPDGRNWSSSAKYGCGAPILRTLNRTRKAGEKDGTLVPRAALCMTVADNTPDYNPGFDQVHLCAALAPVTLPREETQLILSPADGGAGFCPFGVIPTARNYAFRDPKHNRSYPIMKETVEFHNGHPYGADEHAKIAVLGPLAGRKLPEGVLEGALERLDERLQPYDWAKFESTDPAMDAVVYAGIKEGFLLSASDFDKTIRSENISLHILDEECIEVDNMPHIEQETITKYYGSQPTHIPSMDAWTSLFVEYRKVAERVLQYSPSTVAGLSVYRTDALEPGLQPLFELVTQEPTLLRKKTVREVLNGGLSVHLTDVVPHDILLIQRNFRSLVITDDTELRSVVRSFGGAFISGPSYVHLCTDKRRRTFPRGSLLVEIYNPLSGGWETLTEKEEWDLGLHAEGKPWQVRYDFPFLEALFDDLIVDAPGDTWLCPHVSGIGLMMKQMIDLPPEKMVDWKTRKKYSVASRAQFLNQNVRDMVYEYFETQNSSRVSSDCESNRSNDVLDFYSD